MRSSHRRCSIRKCAFRSFAKLIGKHLCQRLFFNKVADLRPFNFNFKFKKFLRTSFLQNISERLLLKFTNLGYRNGGTRHA